MGKGRLEAFSDGVIAIIITIMVLEMKVPEGAEFADLKPLYPVFLSYILSFINVGIYWNNHHHLLHAVQHVNGRIMWANIHLLFWLSILPFATGWMGENHFATLPVALMGFVLFMSGLAYYILVKEIIKFHGRNSKVAEAIGVDNKGLISIIIYFAAIPLAFAEPRISLVMYLIVAGIWFIPDKRIEKKITEN